jgi:type II secretory pathway predicted ATPase ExeA
MAKIISIGPLSPRLPADNPRIRPQGDENRPRKAEPQPSGGRGPELFCEQFGIQENPFGVTPNPRYLYQSRSHAEARASLIIGLEYGLGFQALIAPPGMGKTTILFDLLERFNRVARTAFLFQSQHNARDFLRCLMSELGNEARESDLVNIQEAINRLLIRERRAGKRTIIIIDEAQTLSASVLETVRLLSNFETSTEKLLQIVLAGQLQLAKQLATTELIQLHQRISILRTLAAFDLEDTQKYIEHRLRIAGYQGQPLFTTAALKAIWESSHGVPREINTICFNALLLATAVGQKQVDYDMLREVMADLDPVGLDESPGRSSRRPFIQQVGREVSLEKRPKSPANVAEARSSWPAEYLQFYNLTRKPFDGAPDSSFLCLTSTHSAALAALYSGILQHHSLLVLIGDPGTGKSLAAVCLLELLRCGNIQGEYLLGRNLSLLDTLTLFMGDGLGSTSSEQTGRMEAANHSAQESTRRPAVLLVDEAQDLSIDVLRQIQLLLKLQSPTKKMPHVVLTGRPELDQMLSLDEFRELRELISIRSHIKPLDERETEKYIAGRLRIAHVGLNCGPVFRQDAVAAICCHSRGIPRSINRICESALIRGQALRQTNITSTIIEEVANQACGEISLEERIPRKNSEETNEILKAAKVLLETHVRLEKSRSEAPSRSRPTRPPLIPFAS